MEFCPSCASCLSQMNNKNGFILSCGHFLCDKCDDNPQECRVCRSSDVQAGDLRDPPSSVKEFLENPIKVWNTMKEILEFQTGHYHQTLLKSSQKIQELQKQVVLLKASLAEAEKANVEIKAQLFSRSGKTSQDNDRSWDSKHQEATTTTMSQNNGMNPTGRGSFFGPRSQHTESSSSVRMGDTTPVASPGRGLFRSRPSSASSSGGGRGISYDHHDARTNLTSNEIANDLIQSGLPLSQQQQGEDAQQQQQRPRHQKEHHHQQQRPRTPSQLSAARAASYRGSVRTSNLNARQPRPRSAGTDPGTGVPFGGTSLQPGDGRDKDNDRGARPTTPSSIHLYSGAPGTPGGPSHLRPSSGGGGGMGRRPATPGSGGRIRSPYVPHLGAEATTPGRKQQQVKKRKVTVTLSEVDYRSSISSSPSTRYTHPSSSSSWYGQSMSQQSRNSGVGGTTAGTKGSSSPLNTFSSPGKHCQQQQHISSYNTKTINNGSSQNNATCKQTTVANTSLQARGRGGRRHSLLDLL